MGAGAGQMRGMAQMMPQIGQMAARAPSRQSAAPSSGKGGVVNAPQPFDPNSVAPGQMTIDQFARSGMMGPTTNEFRNPVQFEGGSYDPALVSAFQNYRSGASATPQPTQMGLGSLAMQRQQTGQMDPGMMQMMQRMQAMQQQPQMTPMGPMTPQQIASMTPDMRQQMNAMQNQADMQRRLASGDFPGAQGGVPGGQGQLAPNTPPQIQQMLLNKRMQSAGGGTRYTSAPTGGPGTRPQVSPRPQMDPRMMRMLGGR